MSPSAAPSAARRLARALVAASMPSRSWSPSVEQAVLRHLRPAATGDGALSPLLIADVIDPHLLSHRPLASGLFHWASQQPGFVHSPATFHALLKSFSLCPSHQSNTIRALLKMAKTHQVRLFPSSYQLSISALLRSGNPLEAAELMESVAVSIGDDLPSTLYNSLLTALSGDGFFNAARKLFDTMLDRGIIINDVSFGVFISRTCNLEGLGVVLGFIEEANRRNYKINGSVIAAMIVDKLCRAGRIEDAWRSLEELRMRGYKPDFIAYRIVSVGFKVIGRIEESEKILKQKRKFGVAPRINDYGEFILTLISEKRVLDAKELAEAIVAGDFAIDDDVINALIGSVSDVDLESAMTFCKYMIKKDRFPSITALSSLSMSLCRNERSDELWDVFRNLMEKGYFTGVDQYNVMVSFLCRAGKVREAYDTLKEMKKKGCDPDVHSYNLLMEACCRDDLLRPAKKLWDEMFANGCTANLRTYNVLIHKFCEEGQLEEAQQLFRHMVEKGLIPDGVTYSSLVKVLGQGGKIDEAMEIVNKSMEQDAVLGASTLSKLILILCKQGNFMSASAVVQSLPSSVDSLNSHVILLKGLIDGGLIDMAIKHIEWVKNNASSRLHAVLAELVTSLSTTPSLQYAIHFLQAMHSQSLVSDCAPWRNMLEGQTVNQMSPITGAKSLLH